MSKNAATAILVKSRSKYSRHITNADYDNLLSCKSIPEIANYLRTNTHYSNSLTGIREAAIHRGNLETLLKHDVYAEFAELCKFEKSIGEKYFEYLTLRNEIDRLIYFLRCFIAGKPETFLFDVPDFFAKRSKIDYIALAGTKTFDEVLEVLKNTAFYKLLFPFKNSENIQLEFTTIEAVLDRYLYSTSDQIIHDSFSGNEQSELLELIHTQAEIDNIRKIYRSKQYYEKTQGSVIALLNNTKQFLSGEKLNSLIQCETADDVMHILKNTKYRVYIEEGGGLDYIDHLANIMTFKYCRSKMHFSSNGAVVMASTVRLFEIEIDNLTNIIEGNRYGVDPEVIKSFLVLN